MTDRHPPDPLDPRQRRPDISLARELLHFEPRVDLSDGLQLTVADITERAESDEQ